MEEKQLILNNDNKLSKNEDYICRQKLYVAILYLLLFLPIILNFAYLFVIGLKLDHFVDRINQTKLITYIDKIEKITDFVCENEGIC